MDNRIPEICKNMLGVEIEEVFKIKTADGVEFDGEYYIERRGMLCKAPLIKRHIPDERLNLTDLLNGYADIVKIPWKPKYDEEFYTFVFPGTDKFLIVTKSWWNDFDAEYLALYKQGWVFRTKEEAEKALPDVIDELKKEGLYFA